MTYRLLGVRNSLFETRNSSPQYIPAPERRQKRAVSRLPRGPRLLGALCHHFPISCGPQTLHNVYLAGVRADQDARLAVLDAFQDACRRGFWRSRCYLFKKCDRFILLGLGAVRSEERPLRDWRM